MSENPLSPTLYFLSIYVKPNSCHNKLESWIIEKGKPILQVHITAPPEKGKANKALILLLAKSLGIAPTYIHLVKGSKTRNKIFRIELWNPTLVQRLPPCPAPLSLF
jgi:uncharacterized protein